MSLWPLDLPALSSGRREWTPHSGQAMVFTVRR